MFKEAWSTSPHFVSVIMVSSSLISFLVNKKTHTSDLAPSLSLSPPPAITLCTYLDVLAEILAIPAVPILTASSGYLFGTLPGTAVCLLSAAAAASISFAIGRTLLRGHVERVLDDNPRFRSMDNAIERGGFKLMLLVRLSPLFPFALSNYLYGASSVRFAPYLMGTLLGFLPGTFAYVYAGRVGG